MWSKYKNYFLKHLLCARHPDKLGLPYLRDKLFVSILIITFPLGILVYIPSIIFLLLTGEYIIVIVDTIAVLAIGFILFYKNHSLLTKKILFSVNLYLLAFVLLLFLGTRGPGIILFLGISILATLYISKKAGLISIAVIAVTYFFLILGFSIKPAELDFFKEFNLTMWEFNTSSWLVICLNSIVFNIIIVLAVSFLVDQLQNSILTEQKLLTRLKKESIDLLEVKFKSEESDRLKSAFLANMSHEIRTPMNGILGFSSLLKEPNHTGRERQKFIGIIEKSGARMLNTINEIIDISKIESGAILVSLSDVSINKCLEEIYNFFKPEVENKKLDFVLKNSFSTQQVIVRTDKEKVNAILINLIKNAIKYTDTGYLEFGFNKTGSEILFLVKDTGVGVRKERQAAIFERFIQADIADIQARQGAGLGLSISKAYVEMLGGKIWVESEEGRGSTFYFSIPFNEALKKEIETKNIGISDGSITPGLKILIAEDDETSSQLLSIHLEKYGKEIIQVSNGRETVETCRLYPDINLILLDIQMPELNGYEACRKIREFNKDVIIIAQTAFGLSGDREKALDVGCNDYISKPINKGELLALLQRYFNKSLKIRRN
jgi:signal transduction histidine kinase/CheY-like chemotaxis protein